METALSSPAIRTQLATADLPARNEAAGSGVSWGAVVAGAFVASSLSLALLALGTGVGFSAASPWASAGASASAIGWTAIGWLVLMQAIASAAGGYLAGRLRTKWVHVHTHEVYFRDTAHGFLVWAVGLVITAAFLTSAAASMVGGAAAVGATAADRASASNAAGNASDSYLVDRLLRGAAPSATQDNSSVHAEIGVIVANAVASGSLPPGDRSYLAQVVAARTGVSQQEAERRVDEAYTQAVQTADAARKAVAHSLYWTFLALLVGAFCASYAATIGGRQRDSVPAI